MFEQIISFLLEKNFVKKNDREYILNSSKGDKYHLLAWFNPFDSRMFYVYQVLPHSMRLENVLIKIEGNWDYRKKIESMILGLETHANWLDGDEQDFLSSKSRVHALLRTYDFSYNGDFQEKKTNNQHMSLMETPTESMFVFNYISTEGNYMNRVFQYNVREVNDFERLLQRLHERDEKNEV